MIYLHLQAQIIAEAGPIIIGENNMIEERARIINAKDPNATSETTRVMIIGKNLWIKVMLRGLRLKAFLFSDLKACLDFLNHNAWNCENLNFCFPVQTA